jgi:hypothetical protein
LIPDPQHFLEEGPVASNIQLQNFPLESSEIVEVLIILFLCAKCGKEIQSNKKTGIKIKIYT